MKLRMLREHYREDSSGNWVPKKSFNSQAEITSADFFSSKWKPYHCQLCSKYHVAKRVRKASK